MGENIYRIFDGVWNLSLVGGYCVLLVLLARLLLQKAPKWCSYLLWGIVIVRLCCPVLPETGISLIPERLLYGLSVKNRVVYVKTNIISSKVWNDMEIRVLSI